MLVALREEEEEIIRTALARGLGQYPEDRVFQGLLIALDARELSVNVAALESLRTLTGKDMGLEPAAWLTWYNTAREDGDAFAGRLEYLYPTYGRDQSFMERISIFKGAPFETPGVPAGLRPESERSTYEDDAPGVVKAPAPDKG
jgi:hypothetical protein